MLIYLSLLFAIIGLLIYAFAANAKAAEAGRICFFCGLLVFLLQVAGGHTISLLK